MHPKLPIESVQQLFTQARTHHAWLASPVGDDLLREVYDLAKWGPTSANASPMRILFVRSAAEKEKMYPCLSGSNVGQVKAAPVTAIIGQDTKFFDHLPKLFPAFDARTMFASNEALAETTAFRNSTLQGAYFILAARCVGLDAGPMSGFDNAKIDEAFFKGTSWKSNFLCNLGYGDDSQLRPRGIRLEFDEACKIV